MNWEKKDKYKEIKKEEIIKLRATINEFFIFQFYLKKIF